MVHGVDLVCDHLYNTKRLWITNREPSELSQYTFKRVWRTTFKRALLNHAPSSTQLHQPPPSSFHPPPSSPQHPQQYSNQNITRNRAIFPNLGRKIQSCPFWNSDPKIYFWANLGQKSQNYAFCLKIGTHGISRMLILIPTLVFWIFNSNVLFGQIWAKKVKVVHFVLKLAQMVSSVSWFLFRH